MNARRVRDVDVRVANRGAVLCRLSDGVDLRVDAAKAVFFDLAVRSTRLVDQATDVEAMRQAGGSTVVARREDVLIAHEHRADLGTVARRAIRHLAGDHHEILIPGRPSVHRANPFQGPIQTMAGISSSGCGPLPPTSGVIGTGMKVTTNSASVNQPANRRRGSRRVIASAVGGWSSPTNNIRTAHRNHPDQPR